MAETLQEYLVSVRYAVDAASQQNFLNQLKRVATSVTGIAGEIAALGVAVMGLAKNFADAGAQLYWSSQRLGSSISDISALADAMKDMGVSTGEAHQAIESFGAWVRSMGPGAVGFLRVLGVTASDTTGQMVQLGQRLQAIAQNTSWANMLQYARTTGGLSEQVVRALINVSESLKARTAIQEAVWGPNYKQAQKEFGDNAMLVTRQFNLMGFFFEQLREKFASGLFQKILPYLKDFNVQLTGSLPKLELLMKNLLTLVGPLMQFLGGAVQVLASFAQMIGSAIQVLGDLPPAFKMALEAMVGIAGGLKLLSSPLGLVFAGLTALLLLLDDFRAWKQGAGHLLPWDDIAKFGEAIAPLAKGVGEVVGAFDDLIKAIIPVNHAVEFLVGGYLAARLLGFSRAITNIGSAFTRLIGGARGAAAACAEAAACGNKLGLGGGIGGLISGLLRYVAPIAIPAVIGIEIGKYLHRLKEEQPENPWLNPKTGRFSKEAQEAEQKYGRYSPEYRDVMRRQAQQEHPLPPEQFGPPPPPRAARPWGAKEGHEPAPGPPPPPQTTTQEGGGKAWYKPWTWGRPRAEAAGGAQFAGPGAPTGAAAVPQARAGTTGAFGDYLTQRFAADQLGAAPAGDITRQREDLLPVGAGGGGGAGGGAGGGDEDLGPAGNAPLGAAKGGSKFYDEQRQLIYDAAKRAGLPHPEVIAEVGATQAQLESGGGVHTPGGFNVYGIKSGGGVGTAGGLVSTQEAGGAGGFHTEQASFAQFKSKEDAADAYIQFLRKNRRYGGVLRAGTVAEGLQAQGTSGYATDPGYLGKLEATNRRFGGALSGGGPLMSGATAVAANVPQGGGGNVTRGGPTINTTINVNGAGDPKAVGDRVAGHQQRINESHVRASAGSVLV